MSDKIYSIVKADIRKEVRPEVKEDNKKVATNNNRVYPTCNRDNTVIKSVTTGLVRAPIFLTIITMASI